MMDNRLQALIIAVLMAARAKYPDFVWIIDALLAGFGAHLGIGVKQSLEALTDSGSAKG
jgi:hypothetical protein